MSEYPDRYDTSSRKVFSILVGGQLYMPAEYAQELQAKIDRMQEEEQKLRNQVTKLTAIASEHLAAMILASKELK